MDGRFYIHMSKMGTGLVVGHILRTTKMIHVMIFPLWDGRIDGWEMWTP